MQVHEFPVEVVVTELEEVVGLGVDVGVENVELELEDG